MRTDKFVHETAHLCTKVSVYVYEMLFFNMYRFVYRFDGRGFFHEFCMVHE